MITDSLFTTVYPVNTQWCGNQSHTSLFTRTSIYRRTVITVCVCPPVVSDGEMQTVNSAARKHGSFLTIPPPYTAREPQNTKIFTYKQATYT